MKYIHLLAREGDQPDEQDDDSAAEHRPYGGDEEPVPVAVRGTPLGTQRRRRIVAHCSNLSLTEGLVYTPAKVEGFVFYAHSGL